MSATPTLTSLFEGLTEPQREAVGHIEGPVLVLAGPGSGKTTVVTRRVANLIANGIPPWQILALTFTNKAAGEMRERVERLLPENLPGKRGLTIATFHSFCARLLRRYGPLAGLSERFSIYDSADQRDAIKLAMKEAEVDTKTITPGTAAAAISNSKNLLIDAEMYASRAGDFQSKLIARIYKAYTRILRKHEALDFDDLLVVMANLLKKSEPVRTELQDRYQYILIDEYQDTNYAQFTIADQLANAPPRQNICVVGDPDQSIYGWRGADIRNILEFEQHYPKAKVIPLGQNFRSTHHIVEAAAQLIRNNRRRKNKRLHTELGEGEKPTVIGCFDEHHEAAMIVNEFRKLNAPAPGMPAPGTSGVADEPIAWKDMAVLYRMNSLSRVLEDAFRGASIPYVIARGTAFYERKEVKDALAYLRLVANINDEVSLRRIINTPTRGIGDTTVDRVEAFANGRGLPLFEALRHAGQIEGLSTRAVGAIGKFAGIVSAWRDAADRNTSDDGMLAAGTGRTAFAELVERVIRESGLDAAYRNSKSEEDQERLENLNELVSAAAEFMPRTDEGEPQPVNPTLLQTLNSFLESVALVSDADAIDPKSGAVTLMTLHAAKGLEFQAVAMAGLEEGVLPHSRAAMSDEELEEERRLCFVGITRAKRHLLLTRAAMRTVRGLRERTIPSQFLRELPRENVNFSEQAVDEWDRGESEERFGSSASSDDAREAKYEWGRSSYDAAGRRSPGSPGSTGAARGLAGVFPVGCLVRHPKFGLGRIEIVTPRVSGSSAQVAFNSVGRKTLILEYAKLERVE